MKRKDRQQKPVAEINITPFTDVILVLLIIFMITTSLINQSTIKVNLPAASSSKPIANVNMINITVSDKNQVFLNNVPVTKKQLRDKVGLIHKNNPDVEVILLSDKQVKFQDLVSVLDVLDELGVRNLNIATQVEQQ